MEYTICKRCVMDTSDPTIVFDSKGICNYCLEFDEKNHIYRFTNDQEKQNLEFIYDEIIKRSKKSRSDYDLIVGMSGGVDSSYTCHLAKEMGLKALCLHFDNGWNSDIAVTNIKNLVDKCDFELLTVVMDWFEFKDIQRSFFKAGVIDIELVTDNAIFASAIKESKKYNIKSWFSGSNFITEHGMPMAWVWHKQDYVNIIDIHRKFGSLPKIENLPLYGLHTYALVRAFEWGGLKQFKILDQINYSSRRARKELEEGYGWKSYGAKHEESVFTRFYQNYVLPVKFGIDKRRSHLSTEIRNGDLTRQEAIEIVNTKFTESNHFKRDKEYVLKKLDFSEIEFDQMMTDSPVPHDFYKNNKRTFNFYNTLYKFLK